MMASSSSSSSTSNGHVGGESEKMFGCPSWAHPPATSSSLEQPSLQNQGLFHLMTQSSSQTFRPGFQQQPPQYPHYSNNNNNMNPNFSNNNNNSAVVIVSSGFGQFSEEEQDGVMMMDSGMALSNHNHHDEDDFHLNHRSNMNHNNGNISELDDLNHILMQFNSDFAQQQRQQEQQATTLYDFVEPQPPQTIAIPIIDDEQTQLERIMHIPLNDQRQYHHYQFEGCDFALPYRYQPLLRMVPPSSSSSSPCSSSTTMTADNMQKEVVFLGRGAYGQVIACADLEQHGQIVAIKKVPKVFDKAAYRMLRGE